MMDIIAPPTDEPKPKPPPPPDAAFSSNRIEYHVEPYTVVFDCSEPPEPYPGHTGAPQLRLVEIRHVDAQLVYGMTGWLASHEVAPGDYRWLGGAHGYETAGRFGFSEDGQDAAAFAHSWLGPSGAPLAEREVSYHVSCHNGVLGIRVSSATRVLRPHKVRDIYEYMLPLVRSSFVDWRPDTLASKVIYDAPPSPLSQLTPPALTVRAQGDAGNNRPSLRYQGHRGAPIYERQLPTDWQCKLYHRTRWQDPIEVAAGHEWRSVASLMIGYNC